MNTKLRPAHNLSITGRYFYINPRGSKYAVNIKKDKGKMLVIFDDNEELDISLLEGKFYYRN